MAAKSSMLICKVNTHSSDLPSFRHRADLTPGGPSNASEIESARAPLSRIGALPAPPVRGAPEAERVPPAIEHLAIPGEDAVGGHIGRRRGEDAQALVHLRPVLAFDARQQVPQ